MPTSSFLRFKAACAHQIPADAHRPAYAYVGESSIETTEAYFQINVLGIARETQYKTECTPYKFRNASGGKKTCTHMATKLTFMESQHLQAVL